MLTAIRSLLIGEFVQKHIEIRLTLAAFYSTEVEVITLQNRISECSYIVFY